MSHALTRHLVPAVVAVAVLVAALGAGVPASASSTGPLKCSSHTAAVPYQGGPVWSMAGVRIIYWGKYWAGADQPAQLYLDDLFEHLGDTSWTRTVSQYCDQFHEYAAMAQQPNLLTMEPLPEGQEAVVVDTADPVPSHPTPSQMADEAIRKSGPMLKPGIVAAAGWPALIVVTPPGVVPRDDAGDSCGEHFMADYKAPDPNQTTPDLAAVIDLPWGKISSNTGCFHGGLPGLSVTAAHEWAETVTDPEMEWTADSMYPATSLPAGFKAAWTTDHQNGEIADLCENHDFTMKLGPGVFQMPQLWSNDAKSCVKTS